jgi:hypothetical protein
MTQIKYFKIKFRINTLKDHFLIPVKCRNGWTKYKTNCVIVFKERANYSRAKQICTENNATMNSIQSFEENKFVRNLAEKVLLYSGPMGTMDWGQKNWFWTSRF